MAQETTTPEGKDAKRRFELGQAQGKVAAGTATTTDTTNLKTAADEGLDVKPIAQGTSSNINPESGTDTTIVGEQPAAGETPETINAKTEAIDSGIANLKEQESAAKEAAQVAENEATRQKIALEDEEDTATDTAERLFEESGIKQKQKDLTEVRSQMNALEQKLSISLAQLENQSIPMGFILGQQALLQRQTVAKAQYLNSKSAIIQDQLNFAKDELNFYFSAAMVDHQTRVTNLRTLQDYAKQDIIRLTEEENDAANRQIELELAKAEQIDAEKDQITQLMLDNLELWSKADISLDMSLEEMAKELGKTASSEREKAFTTDTVAELIRKYSDAPIHPTDTLDEARAKLAGSRIYQQQTRLAGGGGPSDGVAGSYSGQVASVAKGLLAERDSGRLTDAGYSFAIEQLVNELYEPETREEGQRFFDQLSSDVNQAMEGTFGSNQINLDVNDDNIGSDIELLPKVPFVQPGSPVDLFAKKFFPKKEGFKRPDKFDISGL